MGEVGGTKYKWKVKEYMSISLNVGFYEVCVYSILFMMFFILL